MWARFVVVLAVTIRALWTLAAGASIARTIIVIVMVMVFAFRTIFTRAARVTIWTLLARRRRTRAGIALGTLWERRRGTRAGVTLGTLRTRRRGTRAGVALGTLVALIFPFPRLPKTWGLYNFQSHFYSQHLRVHEIPKVVFKTDWYDEYQEFLMGVRRMEVFSVQQRIGYHALDVQRVIRSGRMAVSFVEDDRPHRCLDVPPRISHRVVNRFVVYEPQCGVEVRHGQSYGIFREYLSDIPRKARHEVSLVMSSGHYDMTWVHTPRRIVAFRYFPCEQSTVGHVNLKIVVVGNVGVYNPDIRCIRGKAFWLFFRAFWTSKTRRRGRGTRRTVLARAVEILAPVRFLAPSNVARIVFAHDGDTGARPSRCAIIVIRARETVIARFPHICDNQAMVFQTHRFHAVFQWLRTVVVLDAFVMFRTGARAGTFVIGDVDALCRIYRRFDL